VESVLWNLLLKFGFSQAKRWQLWAQTSCIDVNRVFRHIHVRHLHHWHVFTWLSEWVHLRDHVFRWFSILVLLFLNLAISIRLVVHIRGLGTRNSRLILTQVFDTCGGIDCVFSLVDALHFLDLFCTWLLIHVGRTTWSKSHGWRIWILLWNWSFHLNGLSPDSTGHLRLGNNLLLISILGNSALNGITEPLSSLACFPSSLSLSLILEAI